MALQQPAVGRPNRCQGRARPLRWSKQKMSSDLCAVHHPNSISTQISPPQSRCRSSRPLLNPSRVLFLSLPRGSTRHSAHNLHYSVPSSFQHRTDSRYSSCIPNHPRSLSSHQNFPKDRGIMDYTMEDTQNAAPDAHEASKLGSSAQRSDTQSVTKRFVTPPMLCHSIDERHTARGSG